MEYRQPEVILIKMQFDFSKMAAEYDAWFLTPEGRRHDAAQKKLVRQLLPTSAGHGQKILDAGCGTGRWSAFFAEQGFAVTGVDISLKMLAVARARKLTRCRFRRADVFSLPFADGAFDAVVAMTVLEFTSAVERECVELFRCLKPGGFCLIGTLNRIAPINRKRLAERRETFASARLFTPGELRQLLSPFGKVKIGVTDEGKLAGGQDSADMASPNAGALIIARVVKS